MSQIRVNDLTFHYEGSYDNIFEHTSFSIDTSWKLGFIGRNGRGKTTFLKLLMGNLEYEGTISASVAFDYFPFPVEDDSLTTEAVFTSISDAPRWRLEKERNLLDVEPDALDRAFSTLSPGEQTKVLLAALFARPGHFLLIDEPTNHLDMESIESLNTGLDKFNGTLVFVSHDREFVSSLATRIIELSPSGVIDFSGTYDDYLRSQGVVF